MLTFHHHSENSHELLKVFPHLYQSGLQETAEYLKFITLRPIHQLHILLSQLEWCTFEAHSSGRVLEHEPKVDVNHMAVPVQKNIPIVSIFYSKKVCEETVSGETADEVELGFFEV